MLVWGLENLMALESRLVKACFILLASSGRLSGMGPLMWLCRVISLAVA